MLEQARQAIRAGQIQRALALWEQVSSAAEGAQLLLEHLGVLISLHRYGESGALREKLLTHPDTTPAPLLSAARILFQYGRIRDAACFTARALELDPANPDTAAMHAAALERSGRREAARELLLELLRGQPTHLRAVRLLAHIERLDGAFDAARQRLEAHLSRHPSVEDWRLRYELAAVLDRLGDYEAAMRQLALAKHQIRSGSQAHHDAWRALATRQWELTRALDADRLQRWSVTTGGRPPMPRICLLAGFPRSGTTLLEQILCAHPGCLGTDETGILATQFRNPLALAPASAAAAMDGLDALDAEQLAAGRAEYLRATEDRVGEALDDRLLIEKEPLLTGDLAVPLRLFPEAKILMPLRDPRDVVVSFFFTIVPLAPHSVAAAGLPETCRYYAEVLRHWLWLRDRIDPQRWMESRYEDLLSRPGVQTRRLCSFLGLEWSPGMLAHHRAAPGKDIGTPTYDDVSRPLYTRARGRWENYRRWLEPHLDLLEPYLDAFGYR
ncbi:tetratricopeptide repeat-containing sulfotransferase family protein [Haloferula sargassicola]|uniref:Sulfotransferase n=1 Tax=Haloferula sargassicola TaxID=490096 RepID=A0ABP9URV9_9BACT